VSLKSFHILLISLSSLLGLVFGGWSVAAWRATGDVSHLLFAVGSFAGAAGLVAYVIWFARKIRSREEEDRERRRNIHPLALGALVWMISSRPAAACAVCYGEAQGPMIEGARTGVWALLGMVLAVQLCFAMFFLNLRRRSKRSSAGKPRKGAA
jgi:hypothetical protein